MAVQEPKSSKPDGEKGSGRRISGATRRQMVEEESGGRARGGDRSCPHIEPGCVGRLRLVEEDAKAAVDKPSSHSPYTK